MIWKSGSTKPVSTVRTEVPAADAYRRAVLRSSPALLRMQVSRVVAAYGSTLCASAVAAFAWFAATYAILSNLAESPPLAGLTPAQFLIFWVFGAATLRWDRRRAPAVKIADRQRGADRPFRRVCRALGPRHVAQRLGAVGGFADVDGRGGAWCGFRGRCSVATAPRSQPPDQCRGAWGTGRSENIYTKYVICGTTFALR